MPKLPGAPKEVHVQVTMNSEKPGDFTIEPVPLGALPTDKKGDLIFINDGNSGFFVYFDLIDKTGLKYAFPPDNLKHAAIWSEFGATDCPAEGKTEVFTAKLVTNNAMTLKVRNENVSPGLGPFRYMFRVTKDGGKTYHPLDPGGSNQNGPITVERSSIVTFVIGLAVGAIAVLGTQTLLRGYLA